MNNSDAPRSRWTGAVAVLGLAMLPSLSPAAQTPEPVYTRGPGVSVPVLVTQVRAEYPLSALVSLPQGVVRLECVVQRDGTVGEVTVVGKVEPSLDAAAVASVRGWRFRPGTTDGQPVAVRIDVDIPMMPPAKGPRLDSPEIVPLGAGVVGPSIRKDVKPVYPIEAKQDGLQGTIVMDCVVLPDGTVGDARVTRGLSSLLDFQAIATVRQWRFSPARKDGKAVPVQVVIEMSFTLR